MKKLLLILMLLTNLIYALPSKPVLFMGLHYLISLNESTPLLEMRELYKQLQSEEEKNKFKIDTLQAELNNLIQMNTCPIIINQEKYNEITNKIKSLNNDMNKIHLCFLEKQNQVTNKIKLYVETIAKRHNACAVISYDTNKIYIDPAYNITNEVSNTLNQIYLKTMAEKSWNPISKFEVK